MTSTPVTLVTGASRGIGRFLVENYLEKGHSVVGCSRSPSDIRNDRYQHFEHDVSQEGDIIALFSKIRDQHGRLDHLINNAGIASTSHLLLTPAKAVQRILEVNVLGNILASREAARLMQGRRFGRIINFSTVLLPFNIEIDPVYAASKASVVTLTQMLSREFAAYGITVNAVGPTPIRTEMLQSLTNAKIEQIINRQAIRRFGEFRDITNVIDFFLRPESDFVTGQVIYLGGAS